MALDGDGGSDQGGGASAQASSDEESQPDAPPAEPASTPTPKSAPSYNHWTRPAAVATSTSSAKSKWKSAAAAAVSSPILNPDGASSSPRSASSPRRSSIFSMDLDIFGALSEEQRESKAQQYYMDALRHDHGKGKKRDQAAAARLYREAADLGHPKAAFNLGNMYAKGRGVDRNDTEAMHLFLESSKNGYADAHDNLSVLVKRQVAQWDELETRAEAAEKEAFELRARAKRDSLKIAQLEREVAPFRAQIERKAANVLQRSYRRYKGGSVKVEFALKFEDMSPDSFDGDAKAEFIADMAKAMGVDPTTVKIGKASAGSLVVEVEVVGFTDPGAASEFAKATAEPGSLALDPAKYGELSFAKVILAHASLSSQTQYQPACPQLIVSPPPNSSHPSPPLSRQAPATVVVTPRGGDSGSEMETMLRMLTNNLRAQLAQSCAAAADFKALLDSNGISTTKMMAELEAAKQSVSSFRDDVKTRARRVMTRAVNQLIRADLSRAMKTWTALVAASNGQASGMHIMRRAASRLTRKRLSSGFGKWHAVCKGWKAASASQRTATLIMTRSIQRMLRAQLAAGWNEWRAGVKRQIALGAEQQRAAGVMRRSMTRMMAAQLSAGWNVWCTEVHEQRRIEAEQERAVGVMRRSMLRMMAALLSAGWNVWRTEVYEQRRIEAEQERAAGVMRRSMLRMMAAQLSAGWNVWRTEVYGQRQIEAEQERAAGVMRRSMLRMMAARLSAGFGAWVAETARRAQAEAALAQGTGVMKRTVRRLMRAQLSAGWRAWVEEVRRHQTDESVALRLEKEQKRAAGVMRRSMKRMLAAQLSAGWNVWRTEVYEQRRIEAEQERAAGVCRRAMLRMMAARLSAGWRAWRAEVSRQVELEIAQERGAGVMRRTMLRMMAARLSAGFGAWVDEIEHQRQHEFEQRRGAGVCRRAMLRMLRAQLAAGWSAWVQSVRVRQEQSRGGRVMVRSVKRMLAAQLGAGWAKWTAAVEADKSHARAAKIMTRSIQRMLRAQLAAGWNEWRAEVQRQLRGEGIMRRSVGRMLKAQLGAGFEKWAVETQARRHRCAASRTMVRSINRMLRAKVAAGWSRWAEAVAEAKLAALRLSHESHVTDLMKIVNDHGRLHAELTEANVELERLRDVRDNIAKSHAARMHCREEQFGRERAAAIKHAVAEEALRQTVARQEAVAEALHSQQLSHDREVLDLLTRVKLRDQELDLNREILKRRESEAQALVDRHNEAYDRVAARRATAGGRDSPEMQDQRLAADIAGRRTETSTTTAGPASFHQAPRQLNGDEPSREASSTPASSTAMSWAEKRAERQRDRELELERVRVIENRNFYETAFPVETEREAPTETRTFADGATANMSASPLTPLTPQERSTLNNYKYDITSYATTTRHEAMAALPDDEASVEAGVEAGAAEGVGAPKPPSPANEARPEQQRRSTLSTSFTHEEEPLSPMSPMNVAGGQVEFSFDHWLAKMGDGAILKQAEAPEVFSDVLTGYTTFPTPPRPPATQERDSLCSHSWSKAASEEDRKRAEEAVAAVRARTEARRVEAGQRHVERITSPRGSPRLGSPGLSSPKSRKRMTSFQRPPNPPELELERQAQAQAQRAAQRPSARACGCPVRHHALPDTPCVPVRYDRPPGYTATPAEAVYLGRWAS